PRRPRRRGHPARGPHPRGGGDLRRAHHLAAVPGEDAAGPRGRPDARPDRELDRGRGVRRPRRRGGAPPGAGLPRRRRRLTPGAPRPAPRPSPRGAASFRFRPGRTTLAGLRNPLPDGITTAMGMLLLVIDDDPDQRRLL